ncbi:MAG: hypothetical protein DRI83_01030, partial [Bacteroidetes bacterium]
MGLLLCASITTAQQEDPLHANDSLYGEQNLILPDTLVIKPDTLRGQDSLIIIDSLSAYNEDQAPAISPNALQFRVDFKSIDSLHFDMKNHKVFMYNEATINYDDINLKA